MKKVTRFILVFLLISSFSLAEENAINLPWGLTWDTTLTEYIDLLELKYPESEYQIKPYGDTECIVNCGDDQDDVSYEAIFSIVGGVDRNVHIYQLDDFIGKELHLKSVGNVQILSERQLSGNEAMINEFFNVYQEYAAKFGGGDHEYSYIKIDLSYTDVSYYFAPEKDGKIDLESIRSYFVTNIDSLRSYRIFLRNEHVQYSLSVYHVEDKPLEDKTIVGVISILITKELQEPINDKAISFP